MEPISCLVSSSTAMTTKDRRILTVIKFANVFQVRYYKTEFACTEFVDTTWFYQNRRGRSLNKFKNLIKEDTYKQLTTKTFHHRRSNSIYQQALSQYQNVKSILNNSIDISTLEQCPAGYDNIQFPQDENAVSPFVIPISGIGHAK